MCTMLPTNAAPLVLGQLKSWSAFTGNSSFGCFSADVGTAMIFVHAAHAFFGAVDAGVLVVTEEESLLAAALVAPHGVDTNVLAATVVEHALICVQAVVAIVSQHKAIVASAAVIPWNVETLVDAAPIEVVVTFINVFTLLPFSSVTHFAHALVQLRGVLTNSIWVAVIQPQGTLVHIWPAISKHSKLEQNIQVETSEKRK